MTRPTQRSLNVVEWPTICVALLVYGSWLAVVSSHRHVPDLATALLLAVVLAWHGSLQHEVVHGHPFASRRANDLLGSVPLSPRIPYQAYRRSHVEHHACEHLTDPVDDVESYYLTAEAWDRLPRVGRWAAVAHETLAGRLILGPPREIVYVWSRHLVAIRMGDRRLARWWIQHVVGFALVCGFVVGIAGLSIWTYLLGVYLGHALSLVRSFAEHRWVPGTASCSAVVRAGPFFSLLFLNNNTHHTHHARPDAPWYRIPALAEELGSSGEAAAGAGLYDGYLDVARRYLFRPVNEVVHPAAVTVR